MSYTHTHLPHIEDLKESIEANPDVLLYYATYDGLVDNSESMEYFDK